MNNTVKFAKRENDATSVLDAAREYLPFSYYDNGRTKVAEWSVGSAVDGDQIIELVAELTISHDKNRKQFTARIGRSRVEVNSKGHAFHVKSFSLCARSKYDDVTVLTEAAARYSVKARDAFFIKALHELRSIYSNPQVTVFFELEDEDV